MRKYVLFAFAAIVLAGVGIEIAQAGQNCTTTCNTNPYTRQQTCNTYCY